ncbi:hypothetical protein SLNSH_20110 [Alsobacter soli]|uniref:Probable inorganic carbon transporter subunit DabB n=1 Tax=Alsobacter soli TaxID=2109933 RepID=A0A2T1HNM6_9HYPH|nr:NADH-quinone oxidoreductase subunit L [Alsobacter soli]PSC03248.1 hypothetical protein SLNSH_20110 [Alsobacter soli]
MTTHFALGALAPPIALALAAVAAGTLDKTAKRATSRAIQGAVLSFAISASLACAVALLGPVRSPLLGVGGVGLSVYVDGLSAALLALVSFVGLIVVRYSRNYLDGDPGQVRFTRWLALTLAAVETVAVAGNVLLLIVAWAATSVAISQLLLFYGERPGARRAARKKFVASRLGDLCLLFAAVLLHARFGTLEIPDMLASARAASAGSPAPTLAALLIVLAATLKSAQLPLHGWILDVMETPTPVSALLHAGVVNAGGFLVLRLADVLLLASPALQILAIMGAATALFGSLAMLTQCSVKVQLAYSTIAQMGFMLLQCGLGAFSSALLHLLAHSLYKAHAFLSSGSVMDLARASWKPREGRVAGAGRLALVVLVIGAAALGAGVSSGYEPLSAPAPVAFGSILIMGLAQLLANALDGTPSLRVLVGAGAKAALVAGAYFTAQAATARLMTGSLPLHAASAGVLGAGAAALIVAAFAAVTLFQMQLMRSVDAPFWVAAHVHLRNGLYLNTIANRLVLAWWPRRTPATPSHSS